MAFDLELNSGDCTFSDSSPKRNNKCTVDEWINRRNAIDVCNFYGRTEELAILKKMGSRGSLSINSNLWNSGNRKDNISS